LSGELINKRGGGGGNWQEDEKYAHQKVRFTKVVSRKEESWVNKEGSWVNEGGVDWEKGRWYD